MHRPQFSLKTLLWSMAVVGAFCAGVAYRKTLARKQYAEGWLELEEKAAELGLDL